MEQQLTADQAAEFHKEGRWKPLSLEERARLQLTQDKLCMPLDVYHQAVGETLGREVWSHEVLVDRKGLLDELEGRRPKPTMSGIIGLLAGRMRPDRQMVMVAPGS